MRVAVTLPAEHPESGGEEATIAYRLGRIEDGVHNLIVHTGEIVPLEEFLAGLIKQAEAEYPTAKVEVQRLIKDGEDAGKWIAAEAFDPEKHEPVGSGVQIAHAVEAPTRSRSGRR
jgi:hypothetical protein